MRQAHVSAWLHTAFVENSAREGGGGGGGGGGAGGGGVPPGGVKNPARRGAILTDGNRALSRGEEVVLRERLEARDVRPVRRPCGRSPRLISQVDQ